MGGRMGKLFLFFALVLLAVSNAPAQLVSVGALGGVRLTDGFEYFQDASRIYDVGGSVEFRLPAGFAVEADALYQRMGESYSFFEANGTLSSAFSSRERANVWEFPLLGKYYFRPHSAAWRPFVGAGFAFRTASVHGNYTESPPESFGTFHFRLDREIGAAAVAGIRFQLGPVALLPQVRYTYWGNNTQGLAKNEATLLLGASF
jgi:hypothetical protein